MNQNISHRNHYIPQFYLKNWSPDGRTIQTYSILVSNENVPYWTKQSIKNTAVWNDFYTRVVGVEELDDFEHWFDREFESPAKPIFDKLISGAKLSREEHKALSRFVFAQYLRTPAAYLRLTKQNSKIFPNVMDTVLEKLNHASEREFQRSRPCQSAISKEDVLFPLKISLDRENSMVEVKTVIGKGFYLHDLKHLLTSTVRVSERLNWQVLHASDDVSFPTSDDPVICLNYNNVASHPSPQGADGRVGCPWCAEGCGVRNTYRRDIPCMVGNDHAAVQELQRSEERKPPRQHDHAGASAKYAGRGDYHGDIQAEISGDIFGKH